ncbi:hypothetical protein EXS56_01990 [Candidatus Kaiserbacteria bacterium]|nr:hypothetical protein [Candidatus Kaiserbacteria bacterium]
MEQTVRTIAFLRQHSPVVLLVGVVLALTTIPVLTIHLMLGSAWQGITPSFTDESVYYAHMHAVGQGYLTDGNPFVFEYRNGTPLVIFGGAWVNALPLLAGLSLNSALAFNFILWSLAFAALLYWLLREWSVPRFVAVAGTLFLYVQSYAYILRPVNLQPVYPFYFLFYIALARLIREQNRTNIGLLTMATAASFYIFAYLWQIAVVTLGLLFLYAILNKKWQLMKATLVSSVIGGIVGLPIPLYMLWLSHASTYFWESVSRFGLVSTHLPEAEVVYSGGWIGIMLSGLLFLWWRKAELREDKEFVALCTFLLVSGLGLWILQGSNLITGKLIETGMHVRILILPWLSFATMLVGAHLWKRRAILSGGLRVVALTVVSACTLASLYFLFAYSPFADIGAKSALWRSEQSYAEPFAWLERTEKSPVVVWMDPSPADGISSVLPIFTKHFPLYAPAAQQTLLSTEEVQERFLVSQYFNNPTVADLRRPGTMELYIGRRDLPHAAMTIAREIKVCRILFSFDKGKDCGTPPTSEELLGDQFFIDIENKFQTDIKPNIKAYLKKYHVSYILKDTVRNPHYRPEALGAVRVYADSRYEIYQLR